MKLFEEQTFTIPELKGISTKSIEEHLKLYAGYVKNTNSILEKIPEYSAWTEKDPFVTYFTGELQRRFAFEFGGMRNHEIYFGHFEGGSKEINTDSTLHQKIEEEWGSFDAWLSRFKTIAMTRGVGWAILYYDKATDRLLNGWIDEQHLGHLAGCTPILALDMWEHSFVADYQPSGKKNYVEDFFANLNWNSVEKNFETAR